MNSEITDDGLSVICANFYLDDEKNSTEACANDDGVCIDFDSHDSGDMSVDNCSCSLPSSADGQPDSVDGDHIESPRFSIEESVISKLTLSEMTMDGKSTDGRPDLEVAVEGLVVSPVSTDSSIVSSPEPSANEGRDSPISDRSYQVDASIEPRMMGAAPAAVKYTERGTGESWKANGTEKTDPVFSYGTGNYVSKYKSIILVYHILVLLIVVAQSAALYSMNTKVQQLNVEVDLCKSTPIECTKCVPQDTQDSWTLSYVTDEVLKASEQLSERIIPLWQDVKVSTSRYLDEPGSLYAKKDSFAAAYERTKEGVSATAATTTNMARSLYAKANSAFESAYNQETDKVGKYNTFEDISKSLSNSFFRQRH